MKKIIMMAVAAMLATASVNAQEMFVKPMVGGTLATLTGDSDTKMKLGLMAGAEFGYNLNENMCVTAGLLYAMQGTKTKDNPYFKDVRTTTHYLNVPILFNYYIVPGLAVKAGIQPGFLMGAKTKGSENILGVWNDYDISTTDNFKKIDFSIPVGLSYEISNFVIDARYNLGLTKVNDGGSDSYKNSVLMLTLGYKIPF